MKILYHITSPLPRIAGTDAVFQEVEALRQKFGGKMLQLYPLPYPSRIFPKYLYGISRLRAINRMEQETDIHHLFYATLYPFPFLRRLHKPLIYSAMTGIGIEYNRRPPAWLNQPAMIITPNPRDAELLRAWGRTNYRIIRPGIDTQKFSYTPAPSDNKLTLLVGSAPWIRRQFTTKGIDLLLTAAATDKNLRLIFLWRGWLVNELKKRVAHMGLRRQVEIINQYAEVNTLLAQAHATIVLADSAKLVKAFPHSLIESLAAGKPVLVSACIPMADYVTETQCGTTIPELETESLRNALQALRDNYTKYQTNAFARGQTDFKLADMLAAYAQAYAETSSHQGLGE